MPTISLGVREQEFPKMQNLLESSWNDRVHTRDSGLNDNCSGAALRDSCLLTLTCDSRV